MFIDNIQTDLRGAALDWAIGVAESEWLDITEDGLVQVGAITPSGFAMYSPSTDPLQGMPIIEREHISIVRHLMPNGEYYWWATKGDPLSFCGDYSGFYSGETALISAMLAHVAYKLGNTIEVPDSLALIKGY